MKIRDLTIAFSKIKAKTQRKRKSDVQTGLEEIEKNFLCFMRKRRTA